MLKEGFVIGEASVAPLAVGSILIVRGCSMKINRVPYSVKPAMIYSGQLAQAD